MLVLALLALRAPIASAGNHIYTFDAADQLTTVQGPGGTVSYTYDGDGLRFSKSGPSGTVYYVRDGQGQVMAEYSGVPALLAEYIYLDGQRLCKGVPTGSNGEYRFYYHPDVLGTPLLETDDARHVVGRTEYYPFGEEVRPGSSSDPHRFTGKELDSESGLYYFGARYYDAHLGRFVSVDPVAGRNTDPQSWNRYAYGRNNPLRFVDPTGRVIEYTAEFREELKTDSTFSKAFGLWKETQTGREQWQKMAQDADTVYKFTVGVARNEKGQETSGNTNPLQRTDYRPGQPYNAAAVTMTINVGFTIRQLLTGRGANLTSRELADTIGHETFHGLDYGLGVLTWGQVYERGNLIDTDVDPALLQFQTELRQLVPNPE